MVNRVEPRQIDSDVAARLAELEARVALRNWWMSIAYLSIHETGTGSGVTLHRGGSVQRGLWPGRDPTAFLRRRRAIFVLVPLRPGTTN